MPITPVLVLSSPGGNSDTLKAALSKVSGQLVALDITATASASDLAAASAASAASTLVRRDAAGGFSAGTITAALSGNATSATAAGRLSTARTITLGGDLTGSVGFDGTANVAIPAALTASGVVAGSYGSATSVGTFSVDSKGRINAATSTPIGFPLTSVAGRTGAVTLSSIDLTDATALGRGLVGAASPAAAATAIGLGTGNAPQFAAATLKGTLTISPAANAAIELGRVDGAASTPVIDFHSGAAAVDFDSRIIATGGTGAAGGGTLSFLAGSFSFNGRIDSALSFGERTGQLINLYRTSYGVGIQNSTAYLRTTEEFAIHMGGSHSDTQGDPGSGGVNLLRLSAGLFTYKGQGVWHAGNFSPGAFAPLSGATFTGTVLVPGAVVSGGAGSERNVHLRTGTLGRWTIQADSVSETGSNAGSDLRMNRYSDAGALLDTPFLISRATGRTTFSTRPMFSSATPWDTANLDPSLFARLSGATFSDEVKIRRVGSAVLSLQDTTVGSTRYGIKQIISSSEVDSGDAFLFRKVRATDNAVVDYELNGPAGRLWHSGNFDPATKHPLNAPITQDATGGERHPWELKLANGQTAYQYGHATSIGVWDSARGTIWSYDPRSATDFFIRGAKAWTAGNFVPREISVADYGASPSASNATNSAAFQAAYNACPTGGSIRVPPGIYEYDTPSGSKVVLWQTDGALKKVPGGTMPMSLPGHFKGVFENRTLWGKTHAITDIQSALDIQVTGAGGGDNTALHAMVGTSLSVSGTSVANQNYGFWTACFVHDSYSTSKNIGNVGLEIVVNQKVANGSPLWGGAFEINDDFAYPESGTATLELATNARGADPESRRTILFLPGNKSKLSPAGEISYIGQHIYMGTNSEVVMNRLVYVTSRAKTGFFFDGYTEGALFDTTNEKGAGQTLFRSNHNQKIQFVNSTKTQVASWTYDYRGVETVTNQNLLSGSTSTGITAYQRININGSDYLIALYAVP